MMPTSWDNNLRFAIDRSSRPVYSTASDEWYSVDFVGADMHKVFTGDSGDIGTLTLQGYFTRADEEIRPGFFDGEWEFVYRIFNFNYNLLSRGRMNLKVGHFEIPFGLEHTINTNGTLLDYTHGKNIGVKADWGVSLNGTLPSAEYEVSLTRGSGNSWETENDPYLFAARIGTLPDRNLMFGFSVLSGDVYVHNSGGRVIERNHVGADMRWYFLQYGLLAEASIGEDNGQPIANGLVEFNWQNLNWLTYAQWVYSSRDPDDGPRVDASSLKLGVKWDVTSRWDVSAQLSHDLDTFTGQGEKDTYVLQARYRF